MTNHKDEAEELLAGASPSSVDPDFAHWYLARAQVHATLALAEQQRIANLIALADSSIKTFDWIFGVDLDATTRLREQIIEALGLNEKEEK